MSIWKTDEIVKAVNGELLQSGSRVHKDVSIDSRDVLNDKIFFALKGEHFDAHEFAGQAAEKGASCLVISKNIPKVTSDVTVIKVPDTLEALQSFASWHRKTWKGKLVGLTGSNGKTTTKDFAQTIIGQQFPTFATKGNLNNHIGVPLSLLKLRDSTKCAVIEMGMNHAGEIEQLAKLSAPDIVLVTNVGRAHLEQLGSVENIAAAKEEIYEFAPAKATRIYNLDNPHTAMMRARAPGGCPIITYSSYEKGVDVSFKVKLMTLDYIDIHGFISKEPGQVRIPCYGKQNVDVAMAASSIALACGVDPTVIWKGLKECNSGWGRGQKIELHSGAFAIFDAYNANPDSMSVAIDNFGRVASRGKKFMVLGDMLELGNTSTDLHEEIAHKISQLGLEGILLVGEKSSQLSSILEKSVKTVLKSTAFNKELAQKFESNLTTGDLVLIKGSRGLKLEKVLMELKPLNWSDK